MKNVIVLLSFLSVFACNTSRKTNGGNCDLTGVVKDYTGLDGCGLLIELENGDKLNPSKIKDDYPLKDGQKIRFSYKVLPDVMSICMAERAVVEITCIEVLNSNAVGGCIDTDNPFAVPWMDKAIDRHNPQQVVKYKTNGGWAYLYKAIPVSYLYDCEGKMLCETKDSREEACHQKYLNKLGKGKIIWQGEGVWD
jgi:hypothetical protein